MDDLARGLKREYAALVDAVTAALDRADPIGLLSVTLSRDRASEIFKAANGIGELLKAMPAKPENAAVTYAIMSNLAVIRVNLAGVPRANSN